MLLLQETVGFLHFDPLLLLIQAHDVLRLCEVSEDIPNTHTYKKKDIPNTH